MVAHSPSRLRADRFAKLRRYFRRSTRVESSWILLSLAALGVAAMWLGGSLWLRPAEARRYSPGDVSQPHVAWESDCSACHRPYSASNVDAAKWLDVEGRWRDFQCAKCHGDAAHSPHIKDNGSFRNDCGDCHHDHSGRMFSLTKISDRHCTKCHANLAYHDVRVPHVKTDIVDFASSHPEFRKLKGDYKRTFKFNHAVHLTPGLPVRGKDTTYESLGTFAEAYLAAARAKNATVAPTDKVQLTCASCHAMDAGRGENGAWTKAELARIDVLPREAVAPPRAAGSEPLRKRRVSPCRIVGKGSG
jgi:hypothetical protein